MSIYSDIRIKRGRKKDLPPFLPSGVLAFCTDTKELYVGMGDQQPPVAISDLNKWERVLNSESEIESLATEYNLNLASEKNLIFSSFHNNFDKKKYDLQFGKVGKLNGQKVFSLCPDIETYVDEESGMPLGKTEIHLGTDKYRYKDVWVGETATSTSGSYNTTTNGFTEQWGKVSILANAITKVTLPVSYTNLDYNITTSIKSANYPSIRILNVTPSSFEIQAKDFACEVYWRTIG